MQCQGSDQQHLDILVIKGMGFVKQKEMQTLSIEREKGDLYSAEDIGWHRDEQWFHEGQDWDNCKKKGKATSHLLKQKLWIK